MDFVSRNVRMNVRKKDVPVLITSLSSAAMMTVMLIMDVSGAFYFIPMLCAMPAFAYVMINSKRKGPRTETVMNEAPAAIGMMRLMIDGNRSLDSAVREVARNGPPNISKMFAKAVWDVDTRSSPDIRDSVNAMISSLPPQLSSFRRSMRLIMSAADSNDTNERMRVTKDANDTILEGLRELGGSYSSKLNAPCMAIFGLGVMVPMIMVSMVPMLSVGGQFSSASLDPVTIAVITLLLIPAVVAGVIMMIAAKNPFYVRSDESIRIRDILPAAAFIPVFVIVHRIIGDITSSAAVASIAAGILLFATLHPKMVRERKRKDVGSVMGDALFDLGNRLISGENFETSLISSFKGNRTAGELAASLERCLMISRGDTAYAIHAAMDPYSKRMATLYCDVYTSSLKDLREAGKLAVSIGHQLQDQTEAVNGIQNKLRSMLDMMTGTSAVFAPLILGISVSMLAPLMKLAGGSASFAAPILIVYLIELAALISVLTAQLRCKGGLLTTIYTFAMMMPVALMVFLVSSSISI